MARWGKRLLLVSALLFAAFVVLSVAPLSQARSCRPAGERCLVRYVQNADRPALSLLALGWGVALAGALVLFKLERDAPPRRAEGTTWQGFASETAASKRAGLLLLLGLLALLPLACARDRTMPELIGLTRLQAAEKMRAHGITQWVEELNTQEKNAVVVDQEPEPGEPVDEATEVSIVVSDE